MSWLDALILGLVEGITEFLPISSTGHLILASALLGYDAAQLEMQLIVIQGAAILAVCWEYRGRLWNVAISLGTSATARRFTLNLLIAFLPLAILGLAFGDAIKSVLFGAVPVALALVGGGVLILWIEKRKHVENVQNVEDLTLSHALKVGLFQALALIPGTSRSAATIIGGLLTGMSRRAATEFSFFVAIPTLLAATVYELWKYRNAINWDEGGTLAFSSVVAFVSALLSIRFLLRFVARHSFAVFAWYRIVFGVIVLATAWLGWIDW
jgi:undecaprenyl-diphosphatase